MSGLCHVSILIIKSSFMYSFWKAGETHTDLLRGDHEHVAFYFQQSNDWQTVKLLTNTDKQTLLLNWMTAADLSRHKQQREHHEWSILRDVLKPYDLIQLTNQTFRQKDTRDAAHLYLTINQQQVACR